MILGACEVVHGERRQERNYKDTQTLSNVGMHDVRSWMQMPFTGL